MSASNQQLLRALDTLRPVLLPGQYDQLLAQLAARERRLKHQQQQAEREHPTRRTRDP
jgi:hypothetical protein